MLSQNISVYIPALKKLQSETMSILFVDGALAPSTNIIDMVSQYAHGFALWNSVYSGEQEEHGHEGGAEEEEELEADGGRGAAAGGLVRGSHAQRAAPVGHPLQQQAAPDQGGAETIRLYALDQGRAETIRLYALDQGRAETIRLWVQIKVGLKRSVCTL